MIRPTRNVVSRAVLAALPSILLLTTAAGATTGDLYAATGGGGGGACTGGTLSSLYKLDPATAAATLVGPISIGGTQVSHVTSLAIHPSTGVLYGVMNGQDPNGSDCLESTLLTIDPATGDATIVGSQGALPGNIPDIAFDPYGTLYAWTESSDDLLIVNTSDASSTLIDSYYGTLQTGIASDSHGRLYVKPGMEIARLDQYTGSPFQIVELDRQADNMLAFDPSDVLFSGKRTSNGLDLFTIDPASGDTTSIGSNTIKNISALAFDPGVVTPPNVADLSLDKQIDLPSVDTGSDVVFTLTVTNDGPDSAGNVVVHDPLPAQFSFTSASGDGSYDDSTGDWTISSIAASSSASIDIHVHAWQHGGYNNIAEVVASDSYDPDSVPGSGDPNGDTYKDVVGSISDPDLYSIDRDSDLLWVQEPTLQALDAAQQMTIADHDICGGNGLARQPGTQTLYGVLAVDQCGNSGAPRMLASIDPVTASATAIGGFGDVRIAGIAFADHDTLYAVSGNGGTSPRKLFSVDLTDGTLTQKCSLAASTYGRTIAYADGFLWDATYDCSSSCQMVLHKIDPSSFPADSNDPCGGTTLETGLNQEPTGLTLLASGAGVVTLHVSSFSNVYYLNIPGQFGDVDYAYVRTLTHNSKGLAYDGAPITWGNLYLSKTGAKMRVKGDKLIEYTLTAHNSGPDALGLTVTDPLPLGTTFVSAGSDCNESGGTVTCTSNSLGAGSDQSFNFTVQVTCKKCSSIQNTASIAASGDAYETPFDNDATVNTPIKGKF